MQVIYIAPLKALVRERIKDWGAGFCRSLGKRMVELTGDYTPDMVGGWVGGCRVAAAVRCAAAGGTWCHGVQAAAAVPATHTLRHRAVAASLLPCTAARAAGR